MSLEKAELNSPRDWLARAKSNLIRAQQPKPTGVFWEDICFDAQQAVEKALKALLLHRNIPFRYVHHIGELLDTLTESQNDIPPEVMESVVLTEFAVEARYPGPFEPVSEQEADSAVATAHRVVSWVELQLQE